MSDNLPAPQGQFLLYTTEDGQSRVECRFENETIWLSQALMAELFERDVRTINEHLQNLYEEAELTPEATIRKFRIVRQEGSRQVAQVIEHYNLEAIQNKLHFEATGKTAAELIKDRADASQPNRGLTTWKGEVVRKGDITVAKNFLSAQEIEETIAKTDADEHARAEYAAFAERRRAALEHRGAEDSIKPLEDFSKDIPEA